MKTKKEIKTQLEKFEKEKLSQLSTLRFLSLEARADGEILKVVKNLAMLESKIDLLKWFLEKKEKEK